MAVEALITLRLAAVAVAWSVKRWHGIDEKIGRDQLRKIGYRIHLDRKHRNELREIVTKETTSKSNGIEVTHKLETNDIASNKFVINGSLSRHKTQESMKNSQKVS